MAETPPTTPTASDNATSNGTPPPPLAGSPPPSGMRPGGPPPPPHMGHGAFIKLKGPGGAEIAVRCADGEPTGACAGIVERLMNRVAQMRMERREHRGDGMENRGMENRGMENRGMEGRGSGDHDDWKHRDDRDGD